MKIGFTSIDLPEGKTKYQDENLRALVEKDKPKKVSPYFAEFMRDEFTQAEAIVVPKDNILDLLIHDMEKIETRLARVSGNGEAPVLEKCLEKLEEEVPLCDQALTAEEIEMVKDADPYSLTPVVRVNGEDVNNIITRALEAAGYMFFYTSGPTESHAWLVEQGSDIVSCAGKIHTDLARGFIKGDVVSFDDYMKCHNFKQAKAEGVARVVERDYIVQPGEVIEIRFNV